MLVSAFKRALLLSAGPILAYQIGSGGQYCEGPYALCAGSNCTMITSGPNAGSASCICETHYGLNSGGKSCAYRAENLISTYSIVNLFPSNTQPPLYSFPCNGTNGGQYADCIDSPCTINSSGVTMCVCPVSKGVNHYLGPTCPTSAAETAKLCGNLRSSGSQTGPPTDPENNGKGSGNSALPKFYGTNPDYPLCNAPM